MRYFIKFDSIPVSTMAMKNRDILIPEDRLLDDVQAVAAEIEGTLTEREYASLGQFGVSTLRRRFGSWNAAKEAAGLEKIRRTEIPEEELLADLQAVAEEVDGRVTEEKYAEHGTHGPTTHRRHFGSWSAAKTAAGVVTESEYSLDESDVLGDIDRVAREVETDYVTVAQYENRGEYRPEALPETLDFWERAWSTVGVSIMPLYTEFAPTDE